MPVMRRPVEPIAATSHLYLPDETWDEPLDATLPRKANATFLILSAWFNAANPPHSLHI
jgi:hypothetical protein